MLWKSWLISSPLTTPSSSCPQTGHIPKLVTSPAPPSSHPVGDMWLPLWVSSLPSAFQAILPLPALTTAPAAASSPVCLHFRFLLHPGGKADTLDACLSSCVYPELCTGAESTQGGGQALHLGLQDACDLGPFYLQAAFFSPVPKWDPHMTSNIAFSSPLVSPQFS